MAAAVTGDFGITIEALGTVTPLATVSVTSEVSGKLVQIFYQEGQMVKAGDPLAEIDPRPYENTLHQAQGQLLRDQALLDNARIDLQRYRLLVSQNSAPRQQLDTQESLVHQDEGTVKIDQAMVDNAQLNLDYCEIKAPVTGRVGLRLVDLGNYVSAGGTNGIVVITQLQPITVIFPVAEDHLPAVMKQVLAGEKLPVEAYDRGGGTLLAKGFLATVDNQVDPTTGTVKFKAQFDNRDLALFPNQFVNVHFWPRRCTMRRSFRRRPFNMARPANSFMSWAAMTRCRCGRSNSVLPRPTKSRCSPASRRGRGSSLPAPTGCATVPR